MVFHSIGGETMVRDKVNKSDFLQMHKIFYFMEYSIMYSKYISINITKTGLDLEGLMLSEKCKTEKDKYCMISFICGN